MISPLLTSDERDLLQALVHDEFTSQPVIDLRKADAERCESLFTLVTQEMAHTAGKRWETLDSLAAKLSVASWPKEDRESVWGS